VTGPRRVVVLGSTGSVGTQALDVVRANPDRFRVVGLTAGGSNQELFDAQVAEWRPAYSGLGEEASVEAAAMDCDVVLNAITGAVGLRPTLAALDAGTTLALANKESLIIGGPVVSGRAKPGQIVPVDSEHSALAQCLRGGTADEVRRLVLTASGGPFRGRTFDQLADVTVEPRFRHTHHWQVHDLLMWDNCAVQHLASFDYEWPRHRRLMQRITVGGSAPS
jgi:1-deoxy-D-xylulose-5-phosphate reductoisomerase